MDDSSNDSNFESWKDREINSNKDAPKFSINPSKQECMQSNGSDKRSDDEFLQIQMIAADANQRSGRETMKNSPHGVLKITENGGQFGELKLQNLQNNDGSNQDQGRKTEIDQ